MISLALCSHKEAGTTHTASFIGCCEAKEISIVQGRIFGIFQHMKVQVFCFGSRSMCCFMQLLYRMSYCVLFWRQRQEDCMEHLEEPEI